MTTCLQNRKIHSLKNVVLTALLRELYIGIPGHKCRYVFQMTALMGATCSFSVSFTEKCGRFILDIYAA